MAAIHQDVSAFRADRAWGSRQLCEFAGPTTVKLHWTDQPYPWHVNDGPEAFILISGAVDMHYRAEGEERCVRLEAPAVFTAAQGDYHRAIPIGEARIVVVEQKGSVSRRSGVHHDGQATRLG